MALTLIFTLDEEVYGLEIDFIQEIVEDILLHFVPRAEGVIKGAINFHGQIIGVIDLPELLGFSGEDRDHRWLVLTPEGKSMAFIVSRVLQIANLDLASLQPPPPDSSGCAIRGVANLDETMINLLELDEIIKKLEDRYTE